MFSGTARATVPTASDQHLYFFLTIRIGRRSPDLSVHRDRDSAMKYLDQFVTRNWKWSKIKTMPADPAARITAYFDASGDQYSLDERSDLTSQYIAEFYFVRYSHHQAA